MEVQPKLVPILTPHRVNGFIYQIQVLKTLFFKKNDPLYCPMLVPITSLKFSEESSRENISNAPFLPQVLFLSKIALAMRFTSVRLYH